MREEFIISDILEELKRQKKADPRFPDHVSGQCSYVMREALELIKIGYSLKYDKHKPEPAELRRAAIATAASAIRLIENL